MEKRGRKGGTEESKARNGKRDRESENRGRERGHLEKQ